MKSDFYISEYVRMHETGNGTTDRSEVCTVLKDGLRKEKSIS